MRQLPKVVSEAKGVHKEGKVMLGVRVKQLDQEIAAETLETAVSVVVRLNEQQAGFIAEV